MVPVERYCSQCGAACAASETACTACGASLKVTLRLDEEEYPLTRQSGPLPAKFLLKERYRIVRKVGGGFGAVYEAEDTQEERRVALKAISLLGPTPQHVSEISDAFRRMVVRLLPQRQKAAFISGTRPRESSCGSIMAILMPSRMSPGRQTVNTSLLPIEKVSCMSGKQYKCRLASLVALPYAR